MAAAKLVTGTNLYGSAQGQRMRQGIITLAITLAALVLVVGAGLPAWVRLGLFAGFFWAGVCAFQALYKT